MEQKKKKIDTIKFKLVLIVMLTVFATSAVTYGFFSPNKPQSGKNEIISGCFNVERSYESASISLTDAYPISNEKGNTSTPYSFTITNTCDIDASYYLVIDTKTGSFDTSHINAKVDNEMATSLNLYTTNTNYPEPGYSISNILKRGTLEPDHSKTFNIRLWINAETTYEDVQGQGWEGQVRVINTVKDVEEHINPMNLAERMKDSSNGVKTNFDASATTDEGIFEMEDDYGNSYYYRGAVENNYVKFAGYYWRIIRLNGDGSLRIIYDGTEAHENGESSDDRYISVSQPFNTLNDDPKYVGWMYGPANAVEGTTTPSTSKEEAQTNTADSDIKKVADAWYKTNIEDAGYDQYVSDTLFCNDRSTPGKSVTNYDSDTGLGFGTNATAYGAYARMKVETSGYTGAEPTFKCPQQNDAFTVSDTTRGNAALEYPVGLITADEIVAAGSGRYNLTNGKYYLQKGNYVTWSLSPHNFIGSYSYTTYIGKFGQLHSNQVNIVVGAIAPVINLNAKYVSTLKGTGTIDDPYYHIESEENEV